MSTAVNFSRKLGLITLLTLIFVFDDILIYFLLKHIYNWQVNPFFLALGMSAVLALNLSLAMLVYKVMRKKPTTGQEGMIGKTGSVLEKIKGEGKVKIQGEIWQAESDETIKVGEKIIVRKVDGLKLLVERHTVF